MKSIAVAAAVFALVLASVPVRAQFITGGPELNPSSNATSGQTAAPAKAKAKRVAKRSGTAAKGSENR